MHTETTSSFILVFLLPPILFAAGLDLKNLNIINELGTISLLAFLGTVVCIYLTGTTAWAFLRENNQGSMDPNEDLLTEPKNFFESLMFGTLISAVDPVSSLTIFGNLFGDSPPFFYYLLFGESVLNDAVCVVFYRTFRIYWIDLDALSGSSYALVLLQVLLTTMVSIAIGVTAALVTSLLFKYTSLRGSFTSLVFVVLLLSFVSYLAAEYLEYSGIMAILICGMFQRHYTFKNFTPSERVVLTRTFDAIANAAETMIFAFMGASLIFLVRAYRWNVGLIVTTIIMCFVSRAIAIFGLGSLANCKRKRNKLKWNHMTFLWFAGVRGAIAFALVIDMAASRPSINTEVYATTTVSVILFTTIVCGSTVTPLLSQLKLGPKDLKAVADDDDTDVEESKSPEKTKLGKHMHHQSQVHQSAKTRKLYKFDAYTIMPWFVTKEGVEAYRKSTEVDANGDRLLDFTSNDLGDLSSAAQEEQKQEEEDLGGVKLHVGETENTLSFEELPESNPTRSVMGGDFF
jgi:sodium/hydrogen exchanger 8